MVAGASFLFLIFVLFLMIHIVRIVWTAIIRIIMAVLRDDTMITVG